MTPKKLFPDIEDLDRIYVDFDYSLMQKLNEILKRANTPQGAFLSSIETGMVSDYSCFHTQEFWKNFFFHLMRLHGKDVIFFIPSGSSIQTEVNDFFMNINIKVIKELDLNVHNAILDPRLIRYAPYNTVNHINEIIDASPIQIVFIFAEHKADLSGIQGIAKLFRIMNSLKA